MSDTYNKQRDIEVEGQRAAIDPDAPPEFIKRLQARYGTPKALSEALADRIQDCIDYQSQLVSCRDTLAEARRTFETTLDAQGRENGDLRAALVANVEANQRLLECVNGEHDDSISEITDAVNAALQMGRAVLNRSEWEITHMPGPGESLDALQNMLAAAAIAKMEGAARCKPDPDAKGEGVRDLASGKKTSRLERLREQADGYEIYECRGCCTYWIHSSDFACSNCGSKQADEVK